MNKKIKTLIASGVITATTIVGMGVYDKIDTLEKSLEKTKLESEEKDKTIEGLKRNSEEKDGMLSVLENDINLLTEERRLLYNEIEQLKREKSSVKFDKENLKKKSNVDADELNTVLADTDLSGLGDAYVKAEEEYGVNALFLTALTAQESGWGSSNRARTQNNLSGYAVYSDGSKGRSFSSKTSSIMATAKLLSKDYLNKNGKHYKGTDIYSVNETYCPVDGYTWAESINIIANDLVSQINSL